MLWVSNVRMALQSLRTNKMRSLLTMFGIIIGVLAVVVTVSLGEGVKQQVTGDTSQFGEDLIVVRPGKLVRRDSSGKITGYNFFAGLGASTLTEADAGIVHKSANVKTSVPLSLINGPVTAIDGTSAYDAATIIATTDQLPKVINQKVVYGEFFGPSEANRSVAIIGKRVAENVFHENIPIGKSLSARGHEFVVGGVFEDFPSTPLTTTVDFNTSVFIPYNIGKNIAGSGTQIYEILATSSSKETVDQAVATITADLRHAHGGQEDFTVLKQSENLTIASSIIDLLTTFIAGIAAISLIVGGIGVMNIMLVSVTERTREIGIRKSVGASNRQIVGQFLVEAIVLSLVGGLLGIFLSILTNFLLRIFTNLQPVVTLPVMLVAAGVSMVVGLIFGITPAIKAARKDPITALRYE